MTGHDTVDGDGGLSRRQVLTTLGAAGAVSLAGCGNGDDGGSGTTTEQDDDDVKLGISVPRTGGNSNAGGQLLSGYQLAAENLRNSEGLVGEGSFSDLGSGILDEDVELVTNNTASTASGARDSARNLIQDENVDMLTGGGSTAEVASQQTVAGEESTVYMAGFGLSGAISGGSCNQYTFSEMPNSTLIAQALAPAVAEEFEDASAFVQVRPRTELAQEFDDTIEAALAEQGWFQSATVRTRTGTDEYAPAIEDAVSRAPDAIVFNYTGITGANVLREAANIVDDIPLVFPVFNRPMVRNAGSALTDTVGTVAWDNVVGTDRAAQFTQAWADSTNTRTATPSGLAHLAYVQLLQYAAAAERAGSLRAGDVIGELEGHTYDVGLGEQELRACDHQAMRPVPVVKGLPTDQQGGGSFFELLSLATDAGYSCSDEPAVNCSF